MATCTWQGCVESWKPKSSLDIKCVEFAAVKIWVENWWYSGTSINGHPSTMTTFLVENPFYCLNLFTKATFYCPQGDHWGVLQLWFLKAFTPWPRCGTKNCMESKTSHATLSRCPVFVQILTFLFLSKCESKLPKAAWLSLVSIDDYSLIFFCVFKVTLQDLLILTQEIKVDGCLFCPGWCLQCSTSWRQGLIPPQRPHGQLFTEKCFLQERYYA